MLTLPNCFPSRRGLSSASLESRASGPPQYTHKSQDVVHANVRIKCGCVIEATYSDPGRFASDKSWHENRGWCALRARGDGSTETFRCQAAMIALSALRAPQWALQFDRSLRLNHRRKSARRRRSHQSKHHCDGKLRRLRILRYGANSVRPSSTHLNRHCPRQG